MNRLLTALIILSLSAVGAACTRTVAQEGAPASGEPRTIHTSGRAVVHVAPDQARLILGVETRDRNLDAAKKENDGRIRMLMGIAEEHGIAPKDVRTSWISIYPEHSSYSAGRKFTGYRVSNTVMVSFDDISKVESVLSEALKAGVTNVNSISFKHSEDRKHRDKAREMAVRAAREKAEAMASALGQRVGRPVVITEAQPTWNNLG